MTYEGKREEATSAMLSSRKRDERCTQEIAAAVKPGTGIMSRNFISLIYWQVWRQAINVLQVLKARRYPCLKQQIYKWSVSEK